MKWILLLLVAAAFAAPIDSFRQWAKTHGKVYTAAEEPRRFAIFKESQAIIERLNLENHGAEFGLNQFSDLTNEEFRSIYTTHLPIRQPGNFAVIPDNSNADADYRYMLPAVKNQASCGSCWAFSAVANAEGQTYMNNGGKVVSLSEQQLVSCDKADSACNGGLPTTADAYIVKNGLASESAYPYVSGSGSVPACKSFTAVAEFSTYKDFGRVSADATLMAHIDQYGPLSIGIAASGLPFQMYSKGILDSSSCGTQLDHGVALLGYGTENGKNYWIVRNSWGATWGEKGYIRLVRGKNMCGMNGMVSSIVA